MTNRLPLYCLCHTLSLMGMSIARWSFFNLRCTCVCNYWGIACGLIWMAVALACVMLTGAPNLLAIAYAVGYCWLLTGSKPQTQHCIATTFGLRQLWVQRYRATYIVVCHNAYSGSNLQCVTSTARLSGQNNVSTNSNRKTLWLPNLVRQHRGI